MITIVDALRMRNRDEVWHNTLKNSDGTPLRARVNGACQTWKTRPDDFKLPMKYGLRDCFYLTPANQDEWSLPERWMIEH